MSLISIDLKDRNRVDAIHTLIDNYIKNFVYLSGHYPERYEGDCVINVGRQAGHSMAIVERLKYNDILIVANTQTKDEYLRAFSLSGSNNILVNGNTQSLRGRLVNINPRSVIYIDDYSYLDKYKLDETLAGVYGVLRHTKVRLPIVKLG